MLNYKSYLLKLIKLNNLNASNFYQNTKLIIHDFSLIRLSASVTDSQIEWQKAKSYKDIPTVGIFSLIRGFLNGGKYHKLDLKEIFLTFNKEFGEIVKLPGLFGRPDIVFTYNYKDFEQIHRNQGAWPFRPGLVTLKYHRAVHRAEFFQGTTGLLVTQGEAWAKLRTLLNPILMRSSNVRLYLNKMSQVNVDFMKRIREVRDPKTLEVPDTFEEDINRWILESISVVAFDKQLGLINENRSNPAAKQLFAVISEFLSLQLEMEIKPSIWRYYKTPTFEKAMNSLDSLLEVATFYIDQAVERLEQERRNGQEKPEHEKSVLEKLLQIDKKIAVVMAIDMLTAGVDTTSSSFTGILLSLAKNPDKQTKLRQEIMNILPSKDSEFTEEAYQNMPYLRACIKESFRYYPITFGNARAPVNDVVLSGYRVPKGTRVTMVSISLLRDEKHFGQPNEYLPERWLRNTKKNYENDLTISDNLKPSCPFINLPFGFGSRTCIGRRFVELELEVGIARLVRNFHIEFNYPTENAFKSLLISVPNVPLKFKFSDVEY